jgi:tetratricopeptide (TPR) repeat protein
LSRAKVLSVQPLTPPDSHHLLAAQGWLELGSHSEANEELEQVSPSKRAHPNVLEIRWKVFSHFKKWDACFDIASALVKLSPERAESWIYRSSSLHALKRTQEALENLLPIAQRFPNNWTIPYNLACYSAQIGQFEEAKEWFKKAILIDEKAVQRSAIDDPDLNPLWDSMSTTIWKKSD